MSKENSNATGVTRRQFVKGMAVGAAGLGLATVLPSGLITAVSAQEQDTAAAGAAAAGAAVKPYSPPATMGEIAQYLVKEAEWSNVTPGKASNVKVGNTAKGLDIRRLAAKGVLPGDDITETSNMTREAFFVMMAKALDTSAAPAPNTSMYKFKDVKDVSAESLPVLCALYTKGILTGDADTNTFRPKDNVTVAEVAETMERAYHKKFAPAGCTLTPISAPYLTKNFNRFGKMDPSLEAHANPYLLKETPFNIVDNIYYVGNTWTACYLIDTGDGLILIDGSCSDYYGILLESIYEMGFDPMDIKYYILSHAHADHYGCVVPLKALNPNITTFVGDVDAPALIDSMQRVEHDITKYGFNANGYVKGDRGFIPDVLIKDYDIIELGNTRIECITTPGHTDGVQSHFWTTPSGYRIGLYGGAGFSSMGTNRLKSRGFDDAGVAKWQRIFVESIDKVWDRKVDIMLGNHPFHADLFEKHERVLKGEKNAFFDPTEWHRYLQELKDCYEVFLTLSQEEIDKMYETSYLLVFRDKSLKDHQWPFVEDIRA